MYSIAELATARQYDADVTWLIVDDGGYGILREYMTDAFGEATATELARPDFVALARAFGVPAHAATLETVGEIIAGTFREPRPRCRRPARPAAHVRADPPATDEPDPHHDAKDPTIDIAIIIIYLAAMLAFGFWGKTPHQGLRDFLVAGRRLGPTLYTGTMAAVVLGGASTVGGVGLGYKFGISGMWLVVAIAVGLLAAQPRCSPARIQRLKVYTVAQMLKLRYGVDATSASGIVMVAYTLMLSVTSTIAYATIFNVLFDTDRTLSVIIGGVDRDALLVDRRHVVDHPHRHGAVRPEDHRRLLPAAALHLEQRGRLRRHRRPRSATRRSTSARSASTRSSRSSSSTRFGMLIGQDIWQRVFTARSPKVAKWGGTAAARLLPALRRRRRAHRHRRVVLPARHRGQGRRVRGDRRSRSCPSASAASCWPPPWRR